MTFTELVQAVMDRCDLTSSDATARVGREINSYYKRVTSTLGLVTARRTTVQQNATPGVRYLTFSGIEKVLSVQDRSVTPTTFLKMVSVEEIDDAAVGTGQPTMAAVYNLAAQAVTVYLDTNNNGVRDAGEISTTSDGSGNYSFTALPNGTFAVREFAAPPWDRQLLIASAEGFEAAA